MAIRVVRISAEQAKDVTGTAESHFADVKAIEVEPAKLTRTIAALANADGGELLVGIDSSTRRTRRKWRGFGDEEAANGHLQIFEELFPLSQDFEYEFLEAPRYSGLVLKATIRKTRDIKKASDGEIYVRRGARNHRIRSAEDVERLRRNKGISSFESETVNAPVSLVSDSPILARYLEALVPTPRPKDWVKKQLLVRDSKPTVCATLLFAEEPQAVLPKRSAIKVYRYRTSDDEGSRSNLAFDPLTVEGHAYEQIGAAVSATVDVIEGERIISESGFERVSYPFEALHEIITNAVLHRDYSIPNDVHVRIFDNRVEVESPGRLPGHVTLDNILREQFARNPTLVRLINKFPDPPNKDVGEGLNTAFDAMRRNRLRAPQISETEHAVVVTVRHERIGTPEEVVIDYLNEHTDINNSRARELTGIESENKMKRVFERLIKAGQIERVPNKRGRAIAYQRIAGPRDEQMPLELDDV